MPPPAPRPAQTAPGPLAELPLPPRAWPWSSSLPLTMVVAPTKFPTPAPARQGVRRLPGLERYSRKSCYGDTVLVAEVNMLELTKEQRQQLRQAHGEEIRLRDPDAQ